MLRMLTFAAVGYAASCAYHSRKASAFLPAFRARAVSLPMVDLAVAAGAAMLGPKVIT